jgi:type II secretory pathway predicted ATPase ExeA
MAATQKETIVIETLVAPAADTRSHFGLAELPFTREISVENRWHSPHFEEPLADLLRTLDQRQSALLVAPAGTGKTALLRALRARLPEARYKVHYVKVTSLSKRDICREIAAAVGIAPAGSYPMLVRRVQEKFEAVQGDDGLRPVLILDEAHDMRPEVLAILRIITNFDMDSRLVLSVVLAGQPGLAQLLQREELEAVSRRLAHCSTLRLLSRTETRSYMEHRLRLVGARTFIFDDQSTDAVFEMCRGNLRATDQLCRKSLEVAALAGVLVVDSTIVVTARQRLPA